MLKFHLENTYGDLTVCGVDEAGRGPWAGPVVAGAALFHTRKLPKPLKVLNDSKQLSGEQREELFMHIHAHAAVGIGMATVEEIEQHNIWGATSLAMRRAVQHLAETIPLPHCALIDGKIHPREFPCRTHTVVGGDGISPSIAAASIIAKVTRDRMMAELAKLYPQYGFEKHVGYGTPQHQRALAEHGVCPMHRRSWAPIRALLEREVA